jgi:hypothetical protein
MAIATKAETALRGCNEQSSCLFSNVSFPFGLLVMGVLSCLESRMTRKMTKRKRWNLLNPIIHALTGAAITERHLLDKLRLTELSALESMTKGQGTVADWRTLVDVLNLAEMFAKQGIGCEVLPICQMAQDGLHKAALRYQETSRMGLDGLTIDALRHLIEYADLQQGSVPRSQFERMVEKTRNYIKGNGDRVVEIT